MSLINEALKRVSRVNRVGPPPLPGAGSGITLRHVETRSQRPVGGLVWSIICLTVLILASSFLARGWNGVRYKRSKTAQILAAAREVAKRIPKETATPAPGVEADPVVDGNQPSATRTPPKPVASETKPAVPAQAPSSVPLAQGSVDPASRPPFPSLKLQGIFFRPVNPAAMIGSKTLYIGDKIERAKVVAIDRESVALEWYGETNVLTLH